MEREAGLLTFQLHDCCDRLELIAISSPDTTFLLVSTEKREALVATRQPFFDPF